MMDMERVHRAGAEFSRGTKEAVWERAHGSCEHPTGCDMPHNGRVDHITSCYIGWKLGMSPASLRHIDNAQLLCDVHDMEKTLILEPAALESLLHAQLKPRGVMRVQRAG